VAQDAAVFVATWDSCNQTSGAKDNFFKFQKLLDCQWGPCCKEIIGKDKGYSITGHEDPEGK